MKCELSAKEFCDFPRFSIMEPLLEEAYSYGYDEKPNYEKLKFIMKSILFKIGYIPDYHYSWVYTEQEFP